MHISLRQAVLGVAVAAVVGDATANAAGCPRKRVTPNQNLFWECVSEGSACGPVRTCQTISYGGIVPYSTCECLPPAPDPDDYSYGTGGLWSTALSAAPGPGASVTFTLTPGVTRLVVYANVDVDAGTITGAQEFSTPAALSGSMTLEFGTSPADSVPVSVSALSLTMESWLYEGNPTGITSITLAPDGGTAVGFYDVATGTIQLDQDVHCIASNGLFVDLDYYFRPILSESSDQKAAAGPGLNPYLLLPIGNFVPPATVGVEEKPWSQIKSLYR